MVQMRRGSDLDLNADLQDRQLMELIDLGSDLTGQGFVM